MIAPGQDYTVMVGRIEITWDLPSFFTHLLIIPYFYLMSCVPLHVLLIIKWKFASVQFFFLSMLVADPRIDNYFVEDARKLS